MKNSKWVPLLFCCLIFFSCCEHRDKAKEASIDRIIRIKGSETIRSVIEKFVIYYEKENPQVALDYSGGGSVIGLMSFIAKEADIALVSRDLTQEELKSLDKRGSMIDTIAIDGVSIIINVSNPVKQLSIQELAKIYSGQIKNWDEVGGDNLPITLYSRDISSGTYSFFKEKVLGIFEYSTNDINITHNEEIVNNISSTKNAIGYVGLSYAQNPKIKAIPIVFKEGEPSFFPNYQNIKANNYQLRRPILMIYPKDADEYIKKVALAFKNKHTFNIINESGLIPYKNNFE